MKPLFIPLKREYFEAFFSGEKRQEYRPWGPRWNDRTCVIGRPVVLSCGYGKGRRLCGEIVAILKHEAPEFLPGWKECYGSRKGSACVITISVDRAATEMANYLSTLDEAAQQLGRINGQLADINLPPYPAGGFVGTAMRLRATLHLASAKEDLEFLHRQLREYCGYVGIVGIE